MEWALIIGAIVAGIVGITSSVVTNNTNRRLTEQTNRSNQSIQNSVNELQQQLAGQANTWSLEQWQRETEYNTPYNQMQRLRDAGINPSLVYGNGGLINEAASSPAVNMANVDAMRNNTPQIQNPLENVVRDYSDVALKRAQIDNLDMKTNKEMQLLPYQIESLQAATDSTRVLADLNKQSIAESVSRIAVNDATAKNLTEQTENWRLQNEYSLRTLEDRVKIVFNQKEISDVDMKFCEQKAIQSLNESKALVENYKASAEAYKAKAGLDETQKNYIQTQIDNYDSILGNIEAQTRNFNVQSDIKDVEHELIKKYGSERAEQEIKHIRQERITGYMNASSNIVSSIGNLLTGISHFGSKR